eukprot:CAMPEP_0117664292 /NCGR_PEP_ID=MMETSP0804-20121206/9132_1 /TAXON_ID=1074897 /ORGANISM="Tetraselmis astigmatica, Strain CCMP880" /LENGTH=42 /DNA_ID= /DNA_START= /DNA_END= /DNA_ORIENTATION=
MPYSGKSSFFKVVRVSAVALGLTYGFTKSILVKGTEKKPASH